MAQAVAGKIVPITATGNIISGGITGQAAVEADGSASYHFPIWVPDGINGLQPSLSVEYSSTAGVGLLGPRWRIGGLSAIVRCTKTIAQDNGHSVVDWVAGDTFCIDGQRLIRLNSTSSQFFTERETYSHFVASKDAAGQFASFTAYHRDGRIFHYGTTLTSRLHGRPEGMSAPDSYYAYYLDKIEDRYGNAITITYTNSNNNSDTGARTVQELEPSTITWGASKQRSVTFNYNPLPNGATINPQMRWVHGFGIGNGATLSNIVVRGPDGSGGAAVVLKQYNFTYSATPWTESGNPGHWLPGANNPVLSTFTECDGANVCKRATTLEWMGGANTFTKTDFGITDAAFANSSYSAIVNRNTVNYAPTYERIMAVDLNNDGLDDVVYRNFVPPHHSGFKDCVGWVARLAALSGTTVTFGPATALQKLGTDPDPSCRAGTAYQNVVGGSAYPGDLLLADVDGDGLVDLLSPIGRAQGGTNPLTGAQTVGFRAYLNGGGGLGSFGNPIDFLDSIGQPPALASFTSLKSPLVGIGDLDGDGQLDIVRATENPPLHLQAATLLPSALSSQVQTVGSTQFPYWACSNPAVCNKTIPDVSQTLTNISLIDLDGDGTAEVLRNYKPCQNLADCQPGVTSVTSPTMNTQIMLAPADASTSTSTFATRWFLDLNGDGILDVAWLAPTPGMSNSYTIFTELGDGVSFGATMSPYVIATSNAATIQPMVVDYNLDGRQDLMLNSPAQILLSDGKGGFSVIPNQVPAANYNGSTQRAERQIADINGDGLPDVLQLEGTSPNIKLIGYTRSGTPPEMVLTVAEGSGRSVAFTYDVSSSKDPTFYQINSAQTCATDPQHLACLNRGKWLTRSLTVSGENNDPLTQTFAYSGGVFDKFGRGFLGFAQRDIYGPGSRHASMTYNPMFRMVSGNHYTYPYAMTPEFVTVDTNTSQGSNPHHYDRTNIFYNATWTSNGTFSSTPSEVDSYKYDCPTTDGKTCSSNVSPRSLGFKIETFAVDAYGNTTSHYTYPFDQYGNSMETDVELHYFLAPNTSSWLVNLPDPSQPDTFTSTITASNESVTRTVKYTPDTTHGGISSIEWEPTGTAQNHRLRTFNRDATTGKLLSIDDTAPGTGETRTTKFTYEDPDNVYISTTTDPIGFPHTVWRHPGLGVVVETDDPNGLPSTASYDTFGRPLSATAGNGASVITTYQDQTTGAGANLTVTPEGKGTRAVMLHYDSFGREQLRTTPVDGSQIHTETRQYDALGRLKERDVRTGNQSGTSIANTYTYTYDDLGRPFSACHLSTDNANHCGSSSYDGLTATVTDESGQVTTHAIDSLGRPSVDGAAESDIADTMFTYGPFSVLELENVADGTGYTTFGYDVLGRQTLTNRLNSGQRTIVYNAFGDIVQTGKIGSLQQPGDTLIYGRDALGRPTSITTTDVRSVPVTRTFFWDAPSTAPNVPAPNAKGKLVDVFDGQNQVHFDYDPNGQVHAETWSLSLFGQPAATKGVASYQYDSQGRVQQINYPSNLHGSVAPLQLIYAYDPYTGTTASVADATSLSAPLWKANSRNAYGEVLSETLRPESANVLTKTNNFFPQNGALSTSTLAGSNGQASEAYTYQANGLPATFAEAGLPGLWASTFTYDHLSRLRSWQPAVGAPNVIYQYDSDGNMTYRWWNQGELVNYSRSSTAITKSTTPFNGTAQIDVYSVDQWGRTYDTPVVGLTYDAADEIVAVVEKANQQGDTVIHDGLGNRVATAFGNGDLELILMDGGYEYRSVAGTGTQIERCRFKVDGRVMGDVVTSNVAGRSATFYLSDNVGSPVAEAGSDGTVRPRTRRDPYGNNIADVTNPGLPSDLAGSMPDGTSSLGFADHDRDRLWGLVDMRARAYSPALGQFLSPDPVVGNKFDRRDYNPFAYVRNSPTAVNDPSGLCGEPEGSPCSGDGSDSWIPISGAEIKYFFEHIIGHDFFEDIIGHDVGEVFFGQYIGKDFGGTIMGHYVGRVFFGRYIGQDFFGHYLPEGLKAAWDYVFGSSPPPLPVPTAQTPSTSPNATMSPNAGTNAIGPTENNSGQGPQTPTTRTPVEPLPHASETNGSEERYETIEHVTQIADTLGTASDFVSLPSEIMEREPTPWGSYIGVATGTTEFVIGTLNHDPYQKMSGAWTIGFALGGLILGGPAGFEFGLVGGSIPAMAKDPGSFIQPQPLEAPGLRFMNWGQEGQ